MPTCCNYTSTASQWLELSNGDSWTASNTVPIVWNNTSTAICDWREWTTAVTTEKQYYRIVTNQYAQIFKSFLAGAGKPWPSDWAVDTSDQYLETALEGEAADLVEPVAARPDQVGPDGRVLPPDPQPIPVPRVFEPVTPQIVVRELTAAEKKAEKLLRSLLNADQIEQYEREHHIDVRAQSGKVYRLHKERVRNVRLLNGGRPVGGFCIHPRDNVPLADVLVAQKLLLEADEDRFLRTANAFAV